MCFELHSSTRTDTLVEHTIVDKATGRGIDLDEVLGQQVLSSIDEEWVKSS